MKEWLRLVNMPLTLRRGAGSRFSETAHLLAMAGWPRPGHHHACGHVAGGTRAGAPSLTVCRRRHAEHACECAAERPEAGEPDIQADLGHGALRFTQERHRPLEPASLQVAMRRLAE